MRSVACGVCKIVHKKYYNCYSNNSYHDGLVSHLVLHASSLAVSHFDFTHLNTICWSCMYIFIDCDVLCVNR